MRQNEMEFNINNLHFFMQKLGCAYTNYAMDTRLAAATNGAIRSENVTAATHELVFRVLQAEYLAPSFELAGVGLEVSPVVDASGMDVESTGDSDTEVCVDTDNADTVLPSKISAPVVYDELLMPPFKGSTLDRYKAQAAWVRNELSVIFDVLLDGITYAEISDLGRPIHDIELEMAAHFVQVHSIRLGEADFEIAERVDAYFNQMMEITGIPTNRPRKYTSIVRPTRIGNVALYYIHIEMSHLEAFTHMANHTPS